MQQDQSTKRHEKLLSSGRGGSRTHRVFISLEHMADAEDSQVRCDRVCLDSQTPTSSSVCNCNLQAKGWKQKQHCETVPGGPTI